MDSETTPLVPNEVSGEPLLLRRSSFFDPVNRILPSDCKAVDVAPMVAWVPLEPKEVSRLPSVLYLATVLLAIARTLPSDWIRARWPSPCPLELLIEAIGVVTSPAPAEPKVGSRKPALGRQRSSSTSRHGLREG